jgi:putative transposase
MPGTPGAMRAVRHDPCSNPLMVRRRRHRLDRLHYRGVRRHFLTICTASRARYFEEQSIVDLVLSQLRHTCCRESITILAYCFMPDHLHLLIEGTTETSDVTRFVKDFKQRTGFGFRRRFPDPLWQSGYYDHVLRSQESSLVVARYIAANPVRGGLVANPEDYPFTGSDTYATRDLFEAGS